MKKHLFLLCFLLFLSFTSNAQTYEFPDNIYGFGRIPEVEKTKGIHTILYTKQRDDYVFETRVEIFDKDGRKIEVISQHAGVERVHSGEMVRLGSKQIYLYDAEGKLDKTLYFSPEGKKTGFEICKYDTKKLLIEQISYNSNGEKTREWKYTRNLEKREIEVNNIIYVNGRAVPDDKNIFVFDDKGLCVKKVEFKKTSVDSATTFEYNKKGLISKYTKTYESFYGETYEYKYDLVGNWIERQTTYFQNDKKGGVESQYNMSEYRIISYYSDEIEK